MNSGGFWPGRAWHRLPPPLTEALLTVPETPAIVYDESALVAAVARLGRVRRLAGARLLYSIKALPLCEVLRRVRPGLDGFAVSSLFEARLADEVLRQSGHPGSLALTAPGIPPSAIAELGILCTHLAFNSTEQLRRLSPRLPEDVAVGLRVNPGLSSGLDCRVDPCRPGSKLGVPLSADPELRAALEAGVTGLHFHAAFEAESLAPLRAILERLVDHLDDVLPSFSWINLGGGYWLETDTAIVELAETISWLRDRADLEVFFEPGKALVGAAGHLVASVIDRFRRDDRDILVLDTGVHHLPEVFELQRVPGVVGHHPEHPHPCVLAGCSCLPGDLFGEYRFDRPLGIGDRVIFPRVGAYALVKASRFNGFDLPAIFLLTLDGHLRLVKRFGYDVFRDHWT